MPYLCVPWTALSVAGAMAQVVWLLSASLHAATCPVSYVFSCQAVMQETWQRLCSADELKTGKCCQKYKLSNSQGSSPQCAASRGSTLRPCRCSTATASRLGPAHC